ncbi:putative 5-formyltetrahydrofolate cyclo-ligase [Vibrio thalassae]|uniref:5-formyltetrahydrofolate cyclo-ligase n=1 Tax=Vibrio thalassae TaxID=1243014 RepID=A0A240EBQ9_9VIBR|nr:5-formyltetrahydrofolate cyclo-ligase [Vibrio thalassae]SNX45355.1 putative 5-formyltetrahydrofolate cyclo-ligase [Vibrio thalassae]
MSLSTRQQIRTLVRSRRQAISSNQQNMHANDLVVRVSQLSALNTAKKVALYLAKDGELDTLPTIHWLWTQDIETYLPVIHPFSKGQLLFLRYDQNTVLIRNRYQILEPKLSQCAICPVSQLDIIFTPLVAFDASGQRLGMGGGYYDRTLAPWENTPVGPTAIGLAHDCQQIDALPTESWDIPLETIITPSKTWHWSK